MLSGCTLLDAYLMTPYDSSEYRIVTEIRTDASIYKTSCSNPLISATNAVALYHKTELFAAYSQYVPRNVNTQKASTELNNMAKGLATQYEKSDKVSPLFCKIKFESIEHSAEAIQKAIGAKPR
jgi:hypothetical protein